MPSGQPHFKASVKKVQTQPSFTAADPSVFAVPQVTQSPPALVSSLRPQAGVAGSSRASLAGPDTGRPQPGSGRPKPKPRPRQQALPKYTPQYKVYVALSDPGIINLCMF